MRQSSLFLGLFLPAVALLGACGNSGDGAGGGTGDGPCGLTPIENEEYCDAQKGEPDCSLVSSIHKNNSCGVPLKTPEAPLKRSENVEEYAGTGDPDVACFLPEGYPAKPADSQKVTMKGKAVIFSHGCESNGLKIEVYKVDRSGGANDAGLGELVGTAVTTPESCSAEGAGEPTEEEDCEPFRYECFYEYPDVPTETELLVKSSGEIWTALYDYNIFIRNGEVKDGIWEHDVRALVADDYGVISQAAIGAPITSGHGAIAGEVHDCGDVRLQKAVVDVSAPRKALTYFGDDEAHPLPDLGASSTSTLSLYSAIDVDPGPVAVAAAGETKDGKLIGLGFLRVRVYPDSVTTVTFRGMNPVLVP